MHLLLRALPSEHQVAALAARASKSAHAPRTAPTKPRRKDAGRGAGDGINGSREGPGSARNGEDAAVHPGQAGSREDRLAASDAGWKGSKPKQKKSKRDSWAAQESQAQLGHLSKNGGAQEEDPGQGSVLAHARAVCARWKAFCLLLDTLDEFGLHLAEAVWQPQVGWLLHHAVLYCVPSTLLY